MPTRVINIALTEQVPQARTLKFLPDLTSADDTLVLSKHYQVTTEDDGTGTISLPVKASGTIRYRYEIPSATGVSKGSFYLSAGAAIELDDLIAAGGAVTDTITDYVDSKILDTVYGAGWNGDTTHAASRNAVYDKIESLVLGGGSGDMLEATYDPQGIGGDAFARANHTGTQAIATVSGLQAALDGKAASLGADDNYVTDAEKVKLSNISVTQAVDLDTMELDIALKAPLASPTFTGTPTAPTAAPGTNTTQLATTAFIQAAVAALVDASPGTLDTLNELAAALGDDPNFATTVTNALATKVDSIGDSVSGANEGSVAFFGAGGVLAQDSNKFVYDDANNTLKLLDPTYNLTGSGWQGPSALQIGNNLNPIADNLQGIYGAKIDLYRSQTSGTFLQTSGLRVRANNAVTGGSYITSALEAFVTNSGASAGGAGSLLQAVEGVVSCQNNVPQVAGGDFYANMASGGAGTAVPSQIGVRSTLSSFNQFTVTDAIVYEAKAAMSNGPTTNLYGLRMAGWSGSVISNSYGLYMDTSIDQGTVTKYAIYSLSTSPSLFSGDVSVPDEAYGAGWNGSMEVPTKNAIYDKIETLGGGGITNSAGNNVVTKSDGTNIVASSFSNASADILTGSGSTFLELSNSNGSTLAYNANNRVVAGGSDVRLVAGGGQVWWRDPGTGAYSWYPHDDNTRHLGSASNRWQNLYIGEFIEGTEMTAPSAPAANKFRIYATDNGAGKTVLYVLFASGAAQQIAIEP